MKQIEINELVLVDGETARVLAIEKHDGELDYLLKPLDPAVDFCLSCGGKCGGSNWFRLNEFEKITRGES